MSRERITPLLFLTIGWFGIQMAMALDATQFQVLLDRALILSGFMEGPIRLGNWSISVGKATVIGLVLGLGPLAGITVQPLMGWLGDRLERWGLSRRMVMRQAVFYAVVCTLLFSLSLSLWALIVAIGAFFIALNVLSVNYRAFITELSNRRALQAQKGKISGLVALFSGLGGFGMFALSGWLGISPWPAALSALVLLLTFVLFFRFAPASGKGSRPETKKISHPSLPAPMDAIQVTPESQFSKLGDTQVEADAETHLPRSLTGPWHFAFYLLPVINLLPPVENRLVGSSRQQAIFRLFLVIFFEWLGIQALRAFFVLYATKELHLHFEQANIPLAVLTLVTVCAALPIGKLSDRFDARHIWMACLVLFALVCAAGWFWVHDLVAVNIMCVLLGIAFAGMIVLPLTLLLKLCPRNSEGIYSGLYNLFLSLPQLYSLLITGWLIDTFTATASSSPSAPSPSSWPCWPHCASRWLRIRNKLF